MTTSFKLGCLFALCLAIVVASGFAPRIPQDPQYHQFADQREFLAIPNALNVFTNLLFAWVGGAGLYRLARQKSILLPGELKSVCRVYFGALLLIAAGSSYYHWAPANPTLVWDRLPITLAIVAFFSIQLGERISLTLARRAFPWLAVAGIASVVYWYASELAGQGDLRPYLLLVLLPMLLIPLLLWIFPARYTRSADLWWFLAWYALAKLCEHWDQPIYDSLVVLSGHSLKHIAAGIGCVVFLRHLRLRQPLDSVKHSR